MTGNVEEDLWNQRKSRMSVRERHVWCRSVGGLAGLRTQAGGERQGQQPWPLSVQELSAIWEVGGACVLSHHINQRNLV